MTLEKPSNETTELDGWKCERFVSPEGQRAGTASKHGMLVQWDGQLLRAYNSPWIPGAVLSWLTEATVDQQRVLLWDAAEIDRLQGECDRLKTLAADANRRAKAYEDHCNKGATEVAFLRKNGVMANSKVFSVNTADVEALEQWGRDLTALEKALAPAQPAARGTAEERLAAARDALEAYEAACHGSIDEHDAFVELRAVLASAQPAGPAEHFAGGMPRVGRKQARNIYIGDDYIGVAFREQDARLIVTALSEYAKPPSDRVAAFRYAIGVDPGTPEPTPLAGQSSERDPERCKRCGGFVQNPGHDEICFECEVKEEQPPEERGGGDPPCPFCGQAMHGWEELTRGQAHGLACACPRGYVGVCGYCKRQNAAAGRQ